MFLHGDCFAAIERLVVAKQRLTIQITAQHILGGKGDNQLLEHWFSVWVFCYQYFLAVTLSFLLAIKYYNLSHSLLV